MKSEMLWPLALIALVFWLVMQIRYVVDECHVRVKLFGATLRKIALTDIEFADTSMPFWNEHWCNTLWPCGRVVRLRRKSGFCRNFIITPADRDAFLAELRSKLGRPKLAASDRNMIPPKDILARMAKKQSEHFRNMTLSEL